MGVNGYDPGNYINGFGGTSAACPQVSGAAALLLSVNPALTEAQVRTILQQSATDMGPGGFDNDFGFGRLNVQRALQQIFTITGPDYVSCTGSSSYSINTPGGYGFNWSTSSNLSITGGQGSATVQVIHNGTSAVSGPAWVQVTLTTPCGATAVYRRDIAHSGAPNVTEMRLDGNVIQPYSMNNVCLYNSYNLNATISGSGSSSWQVINNNTGASISWSTFNTATFSSGSSPGTFTIKLTLSNSCGSSDRFYNFNAFNCGGYFAYTIYPNPATDELTVQFEESAEEKDFPERFELIPESQYDPITVVRTMDTREEATKQRLKANKQFTFNVKDLPRGRYVLRVTKENEKEADKRLETHRIILQ